MKKQAKSKINLFDQMLHEMILEILMQLVERTMDEKQQEELNTSLEAIKAHYRPDKMEI